MFNNCSISVRNAISASQLGLYRFCITSDECPIAYWSTHLLSQFVGAGKGLVSTSSSSSSGNSVWTSNDYNIFTITPPKIHKHVHLRWKETGPLVIVFFLGNVRPGWWYEEGRELKFRFVYQLISDKSAGVSLISRCTLARRGDDL